MAAGIVIIGNSSSARECYWVARDMFGDAFRFKGFLAFEGFAGKLRELADYELGLDESFVPDAGDEFIIGIGKPALRHLAYGKWKVRGARFVNLIHPFSNISSTTHLGEANIITQACHFSCNITIGCANYFNGNVVLGHDVTVGEANFFGAFSLVLGDVHIGSQNAFGVRSTVLAGAIIGSCNTIAPGAFIYKGCGDNTIMAGNPALRVDV